jgi:hypothetical protein
VLGTVALAIVVNQMVTFAVPRALYPYDENVAALEDALSGCGWILYDEAARRGELMVGVTRRSTLRPQSIMILASTHHFELEPLLDAIDAEIAEALGGGRPVCVVGIFEGSDYEFPWTNLAERFGISRRTIVGRLAARGEFRRSEVAGQPIYSLDPPANATP